MIPLDLSITLLFAKMMYVTILQNDEAMYDVDKSLADGQLRGCEAKNLFMLEDLARINHVFCDKTGTLTKNELLFRGLVSSKFCVREENNFAEFKDRIINYDKIDELVLDYWRCLAICHDVI